jgi:hypothetical protein
MTNANDALAGDLPNQSSSPNQVRGDRLTRDGQITLSVMESVMNITLAGFGGALAGLSVSRRRGTMGIQSLTQTVSKSNKHRTASKVKNHNGGSTSGHKKDGRSPLLQRGAAYMDNDLPVTWAVTCMTFATIVECCKQSSPTSQILNYTSYILSNKNDEGSTKLTPWKVDKDLHVIGDYTFGGAMAGAIFKGSVIPSSKAKIPQQMATQRAAKASATAAARTGSIMGGLATGAAMGFLAGVTVFGLSKLEQYAEDRLGEEGPEDETILEEEEGAEENSSKRENSEDEEDLTRLSTEELQNRIDELRSVCGDIREKEPQPPI